jgi:hypothetical protein
VNRTADESLPGVTVPAEVPAADDAAGGAVGESAEGAGGGTTVLAEGEFRSLAHESSGTARLVEFDGAIFLRLEDDVLSGPDLRVYLTSAPGDTEESAFGGEQLVVASVGSAPTEAT